MKTIVPVGNRKINITFKQIIKRDGREVEFDIYKIANAIKKAFKASGELKSDEYFNKIAEDVVNEVINTIPGTPTVEQVQDCVENILIRKNHPKVAKAYILYRAERNRVREMNTSLMKIYDDITFSESKDSDIKRENANVNGDTAMGTMLKYGSEGAKQFCKMFILDPKHSEAHQNGDIHIHDMDFLTMTTTCCQIDLIKLFSNGFSTGHGILREPNDIASYSALTCIAIQSNQNDQHGGQSIPNFDYALAIGVKKTFAKTYKSNIAKGFELMCDIEDFSDMEKEINEKIKAEGIELSMSHIDEYMQAEKKILADMGYDEKLIEKIQKKSYKNTMKATDRATYQAMEALIHNLNTMNSRAGAQTPFSSINYGTDTSPEGRMIIKNVLLALEAGLGNGETPIFPIHIFRIKEGVNYNPQDPNYDLFKLSCKVSAKRLFPNFSFQDAPYNLQYYKEGHPETEISYMGCRTRVIGNTHDKNNEITYGRGNLSFTSINLPRIALRADGDIDWFFGELDNKIDLVIDQLLARFKIQCSKKVKNFPFLMGQGVWIGSEKLGYEDTIEEVLKHGTLSIGFIGLAECLKALIGKHHGESEEARKLGYKIIKHMRKRVDDEAAKTQLNFSLLATPAEGLSGRFVKMDKKLFGEIDGVTDREYYTNSFHVPVYYPISALEKIRIEAPYHELTNAGHISYVELDGDPSQNLEAFERIIRCMKESGIGYGSINHPVDRDPVCGYSGIINDVCPHCGRHENSDGIPFERIRRITGYLVGTLDRFNNAKLAEVRDRVKHNMEQ
ncbi:MAG: anaerobic ribonucleoside triphosphate reductase [Firmicutes bacterium]|nr:anaerobic ribonucleoside triphosphate reductase [Bacillota bacterium]